MRSRADGGDRDTGRDCNGAASSGGGSGMTQPSHPFPRVANRRRRRVAPAAPLALVLASLVAVPLLGVASNLFAPGAREVWAHMFETTLPDYVLNSVTLAVAVGVGAAVLGTGCAWLVAMCEFPGRRALAWALVLPLALPGYVVAYAYTDLLQFSGPVQTWIRDTWEVRRGQYWFPEIRSLGGAAGMLVLVLYPYVFLTARVAFAQLPASLTEAARLAGLGTFQALLRVQAPMVWPAIAAGTALVIMETLADYGAVSYFAVDTLTVGIYRAWLGLGDRAAAAQLATVLLAFALGLFAVERLLRGRRRFHARGASRHAEPRTLRGAAAATAVVACAVPVVLGFVIPVAHLARLAWQDAASVDWSRFALLARSSFGVAAIGALVTVVVALGLAYAERRSRSALVSAAVRGASLGYAVPGAVLAIGIVIPLARLDNALDAWAEAHLGVDLGLVLTGTVIALIYAYLVRFLAVGLGNVQAGLARITPHIDDAARSLGCGGVTLLRRVHLPLLSRSLLVAGLLVFVDVLKELPATLALRPFNFDTFATQAYNLAKDERLGEAALPSLAIVAVALVPVLLTSRTMSSRH